MPATRLFDLKSVHCVRQQESNGDELYITFRPPGNGLDFTYKLGGGFDAGDTRSYPSEGFPDVRFTYNDSMYIELWEGDSKDPSAADTKIESRWVSFSVDEGDYYVDFIGGGAVYELTYSIF